MVPTSTIKNGGEAESLPQSLIEQMSIAPEASDFVFNDVGSVGDIIAANNPLPNEWLQGSVAIEGTEAKGYSKVYRNKAFPNKVKKFFAPGVTTLYDFFESSVKSFPDSKCLAYLEQEGAPYKHFTYKQVAEMRNDLGSGLLHSLQANPFKNSKFPSHQKITTHAQDYQDFYRDIKHSFTIGLYSSNRWEWLLTDLMSSAYSVTNVSLYDTLGEHASEYILDSVEAPVVFASGGNVSRIVELKAKNQQSLAQLVQIVSFDPVDASVVKAAANQQIAVVQFSELLEMGKQLPQGPYPANANQLYTISYTSGTTGKPKGVMILQSGAAAGVTFNLSHIPTKQGWRYFSFLPLAHIMERQTCTGALSAGAVIGFPPNNYVASKYFEYVKAWKPHMLANVPRIWNKLEAAAKKMTILNKNPEVSGYWQMLIKQRYEGRGPLNYQADTFETAITTLVRRQFGFENLSFLITGAAPLSTETINFLSAVFDIGVGSGMGMTESFGGFSMTNPWIKPKKGKPISTGACSIMLEWRLKEIPGISTEHELGIRGELQCRGPQMFIGYYKNPEETAKAFDGDWFSTGDVVALDTDGFLYVLDRIKSYFKLSQGEFVSPEKIEVAYLGGNPNLTQCFVHGDSNTHFIVGVVGITPRDAQRYIEKKFNKKVPEQEAIEALNKAHAKQAFLLELNQPLSSLAGFEKLHNIHICQEPLEGCLTPSLKVQRPQATQKWAENLRQLYSEGSLLKPSKL